MPFAFTKYDVVMLSSVLHSKRAIQVNIQIMLREDPLALKPMLINPQPKIKLLFIPYNP